MTTNERVPVKKTRKKGYPARIVGGILLVLGVMISAGAGSFTVSAGLFFFAGLITLVVGLRLGGTENT